MCVSCEDSGDDVVDEKRREGVMLLALYMLLPYGCVRVLLLCLFLDLTTHLSLLSLPVHIAPSLLLIDPSLLSTNDILDIKIRALRDPTSS
jgi:hypothetical protein